MQLALARERGVTPHAIDRDPHQLGAVVVELGEHFVEERQLIAADGTPVGGIEGENHRTAAQLGERERLVRRGVQREVRRGGPRWQDGIVGRRVSCHKCS